MSTGPGLRERKKARTRELIADTARRLFLERGFDAVTVAQIARAADVSEGTVFNYFRTKEELFYSGMEDFEAELLGAVAQRPPGQSVLDAFRGFVLGRSDRLARAEVADMIAQAARVIDASPALNTREAEVVAASTRQLAGLLAEEAGRAAPDVEMWATASALMGAQRALVVHVRAAVRAGTRGQALAAGAQTEGERAFARLERGLAGYAVRGDTMSIRDHESGDR